MTNRPGELYRSCRRNDRHDAHEWQMYGEPYHCPGYNPAEGEQAATDKARSLLVPIQAKVREHKTQERTEHRRAILREITSRLANRAHLYGDGRTVNEVIRDLLDLAGAPHLEQPAAAESSDRPRLFHLQRDRDVSGVSGTGRVANGVLWPDGTVSLRWTGERPSTVTWDRLADAEHVHGHGGATRIVWADEQPPVDRAAVLREAADRYAELTDQNEAYDRRQGDLDEEARLCHGTVRDVVAGLRRMADEAPQQEPAAAAHHAAAPAGSVCKCPGDCGHRPADEVQQP